MTPNGNGPKGPTLVPAPPNPVQAALTVKQVLDARLIDASRALLGLNLTPEILAKCNRDSLWSAVISAQLNAIANLLWGEIQARRGAGTPTSRSGIIIP